MDQANLLIQALKRFLAHRKITYRTLAKKVGQSESNIKRLFSEGSFSLRGLEKVCEAAGIELLELARLSRPEKEEALCFTQDQEIVLAKDAKLFTFLYLLLSRLTPSGIRSKFDFTKAECDRFLLLLDKLGLIQLDIGEQFRFRISENIRWIPDGPLNRLYEESIKREFLNSPFSRPNERLRFLNARLSEQSLQTLSRRIDRMVAEFVEYAELDRAGKDEASKQIWLILAYRPWRFSLVDRYLKKKNQGSG